MQADQTSVIWAIVIAATILLVVSLFSVSSINNNLKLIDVDEDAIADAVLAGIEVPEYPDMPEFPEYMITEKEYEENLMEGEAKRLVLLEIDSRDLKKAVFKALNLYYNNTVDGSYEGCLLNTTIDCPLENYRHITKIVVKDIDLDYVEVSDEEAGFTVDLKVYYYVDGDDEEDFKARLEVDFTVEDLVIEDDFEDAEVDIEDLVVERVY